MDGHAIHFSPTSLHQQVTDDLLARIQGGQLPPGSMIPTEAALCREYGVSRITVRRAMADLVARRLVTRQRGVGSFVTGHTPDLREFHLVGFLDENLAFDHHVISDAVLAADEQIAAALGIKPGAPVRHNCSVVHRVGEPFTLTNAYTADLPDRRAEPTDYAGRVPSALAMSQRLGRRIDRAEQELDAVAADAPAARHFNVRRGAPVIRARRVYFSTDNQPIECRVVRYHPRHYRFVVDLVPRSGITAFEAPPTPKRGSADQKTSPENKP